MAVVIFFSVYFSGVGSTVSAFLSEGGAGGLKAFPPVIPEATMLVLCPGSDCPSSYSGGDQLSLGKGELSEASELGLEGLEHLNLPCVRG